MEFKLGSCLQDKVSGMKGIATARVKYLNGCIQYCIVPKSQTGNDRPDGFYIDVDQLDYVDSGIDVIPNNTGGTQIDCPRF